MADDYDLSGRGTRSASGIVRQGQNVKTGRRVTVKSSGMLVSATDGRNIVEAAMEAHKQLDHEHVAKVEDVYLTNLSIHNVMERLEGGDLCAALAQRGCFSEEDAKVVLRQLLGAVDHLHRRHIVHRDIKLESIMFADSGGTTVKLIDLCLATTWEGHSTMSLRCGTVDFSSPEMLHGEYTEKTDMWSVGVVAYMLLTGEALYRGSEWEIRTQAKAGRPRFCQRLGSAAAQDLVDSLLAHNPVHRLSAADALSHAWFSDAGNEA